MARVPRGSIREIKRLAAPAAYLVIKEAVKGRFWYQVGWTNNDITLRIEDANHVYDRRTGRLKQTHRF